MSVTGKGPGRLEKGPPVVVLQEDGRWWRFTEPAGSVVAYHVADVLQSIRDIEQAVESGQLYAAGYIAYEAAAAYGLAVRDGSRDAPPLLWFGLFQGREPIDALELTGELHIGEWRPTVSLTAYKKAIAHIKEAIAAGHTYQANLTFHLQAEFAGDPWSLFSGLAGAQRANYCAYIDMGRFAICSASPELFFSLDGQTITSRPMKGTASRGLTTEGDRQQIAWLRESEKNRAENVMIVDMIRNDLGRVAEIGSVQASDLFTVERYPTLLQMTSTVKARTSAGLADILAATFPCASITGAPKVRTMQILQDLEVEPRGVYTGAIGYVAPGRSAQFNVAIRTALIDRELGRATYGVGSGIIWDSDAETEYAECLLKARVLAGSHRPPPEFQLLESLRWTSGEGYFLLERHLDRLMGSAEYFSFVADRTAVERTLLEQAANLTEPSKVRLLLHRNGAMSVAAQPLSENAWSEPVTVGLARAPISSKDVFLYHKTTHRESYLAARASRPDCDEVILWNERGELTEAANFNIILEIDGRRVTPPLSSGVLAGTFRGCLLENGEIEEAVLSTSDLARATRLWLTNSVRGRLEARLLESMVRGKP